MTETRINHRNRDRRGGHKGSFFKGIQPAIYEGVLWAPEGRKCAKRILKRRLRYSSLSLVQEDITAYYEDKHLNYLEQRQIEMDDENFYAHMEEEHESIFDDDDYDPYERINDYDEYEYELNNFCDDDDHDYRHDYNEMKSDYPNFFNPAPLHQDSGESLVDILTRIMKEQSNV